jgi:tetratricopeptide (TPR) repeat protein
MERLMHWLRLASRAILAICFVVGTLVLSADGGPPPSISSSTLSVAQQAFFNARYEEAAAHAFELRAMAPDDLAAYELRTTALLFQVKRLIGDDKKRNKDLKACHRCGELIADFLKDTSAAQILARDRLRADPADEVAQFFLGKIDLNYVWLQLGPLERKTGWSEYWEARRSLDSVLRRNPDHVRARVARAWVDYIVGTRMPRGTKWLMGGGNRQRALSALRKAASTSADFYSSAEARFALWEMLIREQDVNAAVGVARELMRDFPSNDELVKFVDAHAGSEDGKDSEPSVYILLDGARLDRHGFWLSRARGSRTTQADS